MNYQTWNDLIAKHFFRPDKAGSTVYLYVTEELITELGQVSGADLQDFIKAVKTGPMGVTGKGICEKAWKSMEFWKYRCGRRGYPLYVGYLALFVLAAGIEGDFAAHAYYCRLRTLLSEEATSGQYRDFDQMRILWDDLARWANEDKSGELGIFNINIAGSWIHVGRPIAQTLLTEEERKMLPAIFAAADLDPTSPPSDQELARLLARYGRKYLRNRTLQLLEETSDSNELRLALSERIIDELCTWDGTAALSSEEETQVYGSLRLCCKLNIVAERATMTFRCSTKHDFPEDGLFLVIDGHSDCFFCKEEVMSWSAPIRAKLSGKPLDASQFDWCQGVQMQDSDSRWRFKLPPSFIRIFINGAAFGLPDQVEVRQLPKALPFYIAVHQECCELIERWGESSCKGFKKLPMMEGLPQGWYFFKADAAYSDEIIKRVYPILAFTTNVRLDLKGGIRLDKSNEFFKFAPPKVLLQGSDESVQVYCNDNDIDIPLDYNEAEGIYELPKHITSRTKLVIEARQNKDEVVRRCSLSLVEDFSWPYKIDRQLLDCFGYYHKNVDNNLEGVAGALVQGFNPPSFNFNTFLPVQGKQRIFFVGKEQGQVAIWPEELLPTNWLPVWAICQGRRRQAMFCGTSLVESQPTQSTCKDRRKLGKWKEILWHDRKRTSAPIGDRRIRELWQKFQKEAERVKG